MNVKFSRLACIGVNHSGQFFTISFFSFADDNFDQWSNKSATPSPIISGSRIPHGVVTARDLVRDFRESSVNSRSSADSFGIEPDYREDSVPRDDPLRHPSPFSRQHQHGGSTTSLGVRLTFIFFCMFILIKRE